MERLTNSDKEIPTLDDNAEYWLKAYFKLKDYEDLEEQGRLIKLPCDKAYYIVDKNNPRFAMVNCKSITDLTLYEINEIDIGGIYFSTEELAEAKLKELRGGEDESSNS